ncbi:hypothetical protein BDV29DRAFT_185847 [Aspergillus leporis]|uniref:Uncharacterized protein n=1 Tax=Aspergillus leporis TaxID=41062 RepID=A0A5N5WK13_9EURO|nr:hypothetical protein BDV29DRAFT_185847 [Aspergillus leporis]
MSYIIRVLDSSLYSRFIHLLSSYYGVLLELKYDWDWRKLHSSQRKRLQYRVAQRKFREKTKARKQSTFSGT